MGVWRNGSASDFDCRSPSEGCSFEYCHAHFFCFVISPRDALSSETRLPPRHFSFFMFGQQQQQQPAGGPFGSTTQGSTSTGTGLFGSTTTQQPSGFGTTQNPSTSTGTGLFGSTFGSTTQPTQNTGGGLFGSQPAANTQPTSHLFPSTTAQQPLTTSIFGTSTVTQPQQTQSGLFAQSTGGFGGSGGGPLSSTLSANPLRTSLASSQLNSDPGAQCAALMQRIEGIKNAWDAGSPQCKFQVSTRSTLRFRGRLSNPGRSYLALLLQSRRPQPGPHVWAPRERD